MDYNISIDQRDFHGNTPLHYLALGSLRKNYSQIIHQLWQRAKSYWLDYLDLENDDEENVLALACKYGRSSLVEILLKCGGNRQKILPMHLAIIGGHVEIVVLLIKYNFSINKPNHRGETSWHLICQYNRIDLLEILFHYDDNFEKQDHRGFTALLTAGFYNHRLCVERLIRRGADLSARDHRGKSLCTTKNAMFSFSFVHRFSLLVQICIEQQCVETVEFCFKWIEDQRSFHYLLTENDRNGDTILHSSFSF